MSNLCDLFFIFIFIFIIINRMNIDTLILMLIFCTIFFLGNNVDEEGE